MRLIKQLLNWFVHGSSQTAKPNGVTETAASNGSKPPETNEQTSPTVHLSEAPSTDPKDFLKELKSIPPLSKEFEKSRQEFIEELKKLAAPPKPDK